MITLTPKEQKVFDSMLDLGCTEEEAYEVIEADRKIDKGEKLFELDPELEKGAKKARQADRKPTVYNFQKRERKPNGEKRELIEILRMALVENGVTDIEVTNIERELNFHYGEKKFKVVLSAPRS